jgi:hypothetical protein
VRQLWELDVGGSNPSTPTKDFSKLAQLDRSDDVVVATPVATCFAVPAPPSRHQLCIAANALEELARARVVSEAEPLELVAAWLRRVATPSVRSSDESGRCECGAALAHVAGADVSAVLCPSCDAERLHEFGDRDMADELSLSIELTQLGKEAARDAWVEHAGDTRTVPRYPGLHADQPLTEPERRVFVQAYQNELRALAASSEQHGRGLALSGALLALCLLVLTSCASAHGRLEGPPLYVHLCDAMPAADREAWGSAAGELNEELGELALWVGHGAPRGCNSVDVCPSAELSAGVETRIGTCVITVRYAPGSVQEVAAQELGDILDEL